MWSNDPWVGKKIERCLIEKPLGRGGHAFAYLAFDEELKEHRVLKIALPNLGSKEFVSGGEAQAFLEEGLLLSRLKHAQIVTLRSQGEFEGSRYMLLDYIRGPSLKEILTHVSERVEKTGCTWSQVIPPITALAIITSAARPLAYAHGANVHLPGRETQGVAHRDISPGNLILGNRGDERGKVVLIDFGTAKTNLDTLTTMRQGPVGTIPYMSMVRLQKGGDNSTANAIFWKGFRETRHDVHALGALFFQLLTGKLPFPGEGAPQIIASIMDAGRYRALGPDAEALLPGSGALISQCMVWNQLSLPWDKQPLQYTDAANLLIDLETLLAKVAPHRTPEELLRIFLENLPTATTPAAIEIPTEFIPAKKKQSPPHAKFQPKPKQNTPVSKLSWVAGTVVVLILLSVGLGFFIQSKNPLLETELPPWDSTQTKTDAEPPPDTLILQPTLPKARAKKIKPLIAADNPNQTNALTIEEFLILQALVRTEPRSAQSALYKAEAQFPHSTDLQFLQCQVSFAMEEWSLEFRSLLESMLQKQPQFTNPKLFRENLSFWRWKNDQALYQKHPGSEIFRNNIAQSAQGYLREFGENPLLRAKISGSQPE